VTGYLGADALGLECVSDFVKTCREQAEPASQQDCARVGMDGTAIEEGDDRNHARPQADMVFGSFARVYSYAQLRRFAGSDDTNIFSGHASAS
jgi:hypothetical protein